MKLSALNQRWNCQSLSLSEGNETISLCRKKSVNDLAEVGKPMRIGELFLLWRPHDGLNKSAGGDCKGRVELRWKGDVAGAMCRMRLLDSIVADRMEPPARDQGFVSAKLVHASMNGNTSELLMFFTCLGRVSAWARTGTSITRYRICACSGHCARPNSI